MDANASALVSACAAGFVAVVIAAVVVARSVRTPSAVATGRVRFPARALERAVVVGVFATALAAFASLDEAGRVSADVVVGVCAVVTSLAWMAWRGSFMSLRAAERTPDRDGGRRG